MAMIQNLIKYRNFSKLKRTFTVGKIIFNKPSVPDVPGLSEACLKVPDTPVGPGAAKNTDYKNPEYFSYNKNSYFEAEVEMQQYRCPQPSVKEYYKAPPTK